MVSTVTSYTDSRNKAAPGQGYDGVVKVSTGGVYGTGVLLYGGQAILTAAHLFKPGNSQSTVTFETSAGTKSMSSSKVTILPGYDAANLNNDMAIVWLNGHAPVSAERYDIYRNTDEIGQAMTIIGYGKPGTGAAGMSSSYSSAPIRQKAMNTFDADAAALKAKAGGYLPFSPKAGTQLIADFDNGSSNQDALGRFLNLKHTGLGQNEGMLSSGDSGGPAFIGNKVAGIASYISTLSLGNVRPDIDNSLNSSFGEFAAWQRVSAQQQFIDQAIRASYTDAPTKMSEVKQKVVEGQAGTFTNAYFMVELTTPRKDPNKLISLNFTTRDGTAKAGEDYLANKGTLVFYPNETKAVVAVEIVGDNKLESNETFYMDFTNPSGAAFDNGALVLTGMRTILNDDVWLV
ncbi:trypsin-like serine protease [Pseudomonas sp. LJDD11]|uniref:Calx-beta domain-containing protein n=1 Tax=unclassified Pseudomonas TaxID=196821 RepID=UPI0009FDE958|nr:MULTISPECIES: Calx-beta domain-containing protein [unclassified Pseudomonas]MCQ9425605.1 trypsin-like serine protease [Pseudomonas sp. LJDD11]